MLVDGNILEFARRGALPYGSQGHASILIACVFYDGCGNAAYGPPRLLLLLA